MKTMHGVITAMTTPFLENGEVDFISLDEQTEFLIEKGVNCLYPCGTTGEMLLMTLEQREAVAERVVKKAAGRLTVFIHTGALREEDTLRLCLHAKAIGADGAGVVNTAFFGMPDREIEEFYVRVAAVVPGFPVYVYNIPQCSTNDISAELCGRIAQRCPNVVGIKYSFCDMHRTLDYLRIRGGDFSVLVGFDRLLLPALAIGCGGTVSGMSSVFPEPLVACYRAWQKGDLAAAQKALWQADYLVKALRSGSHPGYFKAGQQLRGLKGGHVHRPYLDIGPEERLALAEALAGYL